MSNSRDIKRRIKSVKSTQQITKAMKMVSASKLRKSQAAVQAVRPYTRKIEDIILDVSGSVEHAFLQERSQIKKVCYLVFGSDRGLCGGFNGNLHRFLSNKLKEETHEYAVAIIGRKVWEYCSKQNYPISFHNTTIGDNPDFHQAREVASLMANAFKSGEFDEIYLVYSEFKSVMVQIPQVKRLLPVVPPEENEQGSIMFKHDYIYEPTIEDFLEVILPQYLDMGVYTAMQEAKASEHGARMTAMSGATDNASDMIGKLTLSLNRARQAAITTEISEIVGGASALT